MDHSPESRGEADRDHYWRCYGWCVVGIEGGGTVGGNVTIDGGELWTSYGTATIESDLTLLNSGLNSAVLSITNDGNLSMGRLSIKGDLTFTSSRDHVTLGTPNADAPVIANGNVSLNNVTVDVGTTSKLAPGNYGLIQAGKSMTGVPTRGALLTNYALQVNGNRLDLVVS